MHVPTSLLTLYILFLHRCQQVDQSNTQNTLSVPHDKSDRNTDNTVNHTFQSTLPISLVLSTDTRQSLKAKNKIETMVCVIYHVQTVSVLDFMYVTSILHNIVFI